MTEKPKKVLVGPRIPTRISIGEDGVVRTPKETAEELKTRRETGDK